MLTSIDKGSSRNVFIKINVECFFLEYIYRNWSSCTKLALRAS